MLLGGIGFQPVRNTGKMTGWKPIPRFFHNLSAWERPLEALPPSSLIPLQSPAGSSTVCRSSPWARPYPAVLQAR